MQIEIEKKYHLTNSDHAIIKDKCDFIKEVTLEDYYLDKNFTLIKKGCFLRLRNGLYEFKIQHFNEKTRLASSEEYEDEEEIEKILKNYGISTEDVKGIMFIKTVRQKYTYNYKGQKINIDVEQYQYGTRYELEILYQEEGKDINREKKEEELNALIENFRKELGLTAGSDVTTLKGVMCAMHQNIELYEIMTQNTIK